GTGRRPAGRRGRARGCGDSAAARPAPPVQRSGRPAGRHRAAWTAPRPSARPRTGTSPAPRPRRPGRRRARPAGAGPGDPAWSHEAAVAGTVATAWPSDGAPSGTGAPRRTWSWTPRGGTERTDVGHPGSTRSYVRTVEG